MLCCFSVVCFCFTPLSPTQANQGICTQTGPQNPILPPEGSGSMVMGSVFELYRIHNFVHTVGTDIVFLELYSASNYINAKW